MIILVMGRKEEGKSTLAMFLAQRIQRRVNGHVIAVFDPKHCFNRWPKTSDLDEFEELLTKTSTAVTYQPLPAGQQTIDDETIGEEFDAFMDALAIDEHLGRRSDARRHDLSPSIIIVDEFSYLERGQAPAWIETLVRLARKPDVYLLLAAHRPVEFSTQLRSQADELFFFNQTAPADLRAIEEVASPEIAEVVRTLPKRHVVRYEVASRDSQVWATPEAWYVDLEGSQELVSVGNADQDEETN